MSSKHSLLFDHQFKQTVEFWCGFANNSTVYFNFSRKFFISSVQNSEQSFSFGTYTANRYNEYYKRVGTGNDHRHGLSNISLFFFYLSTTFNAG